jgi:isopropylmalate/homocitrate/citramalate synthase
VAPLVAHRVDARPEAVERDRGAGAGDPDRQRIPQSRIASRLLRVPAHLRHAIPPQLRERLPVRPQQIGHQQRILIGMRRAGRRHGRVHLREVKIHLPGVDVERHLT